MKRNPLSFLLLLVGALSFAACSGLPKGTGGGGGGGNATVSFTLVSDTLPANPSLLSYKVSIIGISLASSSTTVTLTPNPSVVDLMRLQSDSAFLGTLTGVPSGAYTVTVSFSSPEVTFLNDTASAISAGGSACPSGAVCSATLAAIGAPQIAGFTFTANSSGTQGIGIDFNLHNSLTLSGGTLAANFSPTVVSAFTLPRQNSNLAAGQLDLIEDFSGVVSLTQAGSVTITSLTRGTITAQSTPSTAYDPDPSNTLCNTSPTALSGCVSSNQLASMDAVLNSNGTFSVLEIEPLLSSAQDIVEGTVVLINPANQTQFDLVTTDKSEKPTGSLITALNVGDPLIVNIPAPNPFLVDTKGLNVQGSSITAFNSFAGANTTGAIHLGQTVAVHVTSFTPPAGTTPNSVNADTVTLRWSRFTAAVAPLSSSVFTIGVLPSYFNFTSNSTFDVQAFVNAPRSTIVDGVPDLTSLSNTKPVAIRALFFENPQFSLNPAFFAAKVRQH